MSPNPTPQGKACNPFAMFVAFKFGRMSEKVDFKRRAQYMSEFAAAWRSMSDEQKQPWREQSQRGYREAKRRRTGESDDALGPGKPAHLTASTAQPSTSGQILSSASQAACPLPPTPLLATVLGSRFRIDGDTRQLGEGSYGTVVRVVDITTSRKFAAKLFLGGGSTQSAKREKAVYDKLMDRPHGAFLPVLEALVQPAMSWIVMPLCADGSLAQFLREHGPADGALARGLSEQCRSGLAHLHAVGFLHLDIKPGNLMYDRRTSHLAIVDFGLSCSWPLHARHASCQINGYRIATVMYRAPELFQRAVAQPILSPGVDAWSCGCVMFEMATGRRAWPGDTEDDVEKVIMQHASRFYSNEGNFSELSPEMSTVVRGLLHPDRTLRKSLAGTPFWPGVET